MVKGVKRVKKAILEFCSIIDFTYICRITYNFHIYEQ